MVYGIKVTKKGIRKYVQDSPTKLHVWGTKAEAQSDLNKHFKKNPYIKNPRIVKL